MHDAAADGVDKGSGGVNVILLQVVSGNQQGRLLRCFLLFILIFFRVSRAQGVPLTVLSPLTDEWNVGAMCNIEITLLRHINRPLLVFISFMRHDSHC